jgi:uncharacterized protein (DUF433 family)
MWASNTSNKIDLVVPLMRKPGAGCRKTFWLPGYFIQRRLKDILSDYAEYDDLHMGRSQAAVRLWSFTRSATMKYESSHLEKQATTSEKLSICDHSDWEAVMPIPKDEIEYEDKCDPLEPGGYVNGVYRINGRVIPARNSSADPHDPKLLAFMKSITPMIQMEPDILGGAPVFNGTLVPIRRMFDYLLAGNTLDDFLLDNPSVSRDMATCVLQSESTLFYEAISNAIDSAAMPSSRPR